MIHFGAFQNKNKSSKYNLGIEHSSGNLIMHYFKVDNHLEAVITIASTKSILVSKRS